VRRILFGSRKLAVAATVTGNDTDDGGPGTDTCFADPGDTVVSCP
jgi:hypothetical protein